VKQDATHVSPHVLRALEAVTAGKPAGPHLHAFLSSLRDEWGLDEAGLLVLGADGWARARAWDGSLPSDGGGLRTLWVADELNLQVLTELSLRRIAVYPAGPHGLLVLGRRDDGPLPPPIFEPLISAVLLAELGTAARQALPVIAAAAAASDERELLRTVDGALEQRFSDGDEHVCDVPGTGFELVAHATTAAERELIEGVAGIVAISLGRVSAAV
jgi:hypothetical protein